MKRLNELVRQNILRLEPYGHERSSNGNKTGLVFLDANENPYNTPYNRYPEIRQTELKRAIAKMKKLPAECILLSNGADEAADIIYRCFAEPGRDNVVAIEPTCRMYERLAEINNVEYRKAALDENFQLSAGRILAACNGNTKVIWLCSPNDPTGNELQREEIIRIINGFEGIVVVDEAYSDFSSATPLRHELYKYPNLIVLDTFSNSWGCAGLRLGTAFAFPEIIDILNNGADTVSATGHAPDNFESDVNKLITDSKKEFDGIKTTWNTSVKTAMDTAVNEVFKTLDGISALLSDAGTSVPNIETALTDAQNSLASLKSCLTDLDKIIGNAKDKLADMQKKVIDISNDQALIAFIEEVSSDPSSLGEFMSSPVEINTVKVYPVENYGSAMTPFYTILAIWVGSIVLVAVLKAEISRRDIEKLGSNVIPIQAYFGRYMIYLLVSIIQAIIIALGDLLFLKVQCEDPLLFIIAAVVSSIVFSLLIYSLTITFSVIQVAGSGGTFPPEVLPEFFRSILPYLPFRYSINAMREAVAGVYAQSYIEDLLCLLIYVAIALFIGIVLRKPCIRIMKFFNKRLEDTDLII